jgi:hypothetical protein
MPGVGSSEGVRRPAVAAAGPDGTPPRQRKGLRQLGAALVVGLVSVGSAVAAVRVTGGGDGDPPAAPRPAEERLVSQISAYVYEAGGIGTISPGQADCVARHIVDRVGADRLSELDVATQLEDPSKPPLVFGTDAQDAFRESFRCFGDEVLMAFMAATVQTAGKVGPEQAVCTVQGWMDEIGRTALIDLYTVLSTEGAANLSAEQNDVLLSVAAGCAPAPAPAATP